MIEFKHIYKAYDKGIHTISDLNLKIEDGEFVFIVGSSGSGKTTLIKLLLKEIEATSGSIMVGDTDICRMRKRHIPGYRRRLGVVFQDFRLLQDRNVYDNVAFAQRVVMAPAREMKHRVPEVLGLVGLSAKYKAYPKQLSGGEQQRVAIARALVNRPEILLADEPTGNMDPENAWHIMELVEKINEMGTTVVVVTHSQEIVDRMQKRVITMKRGVVVSDEKGGYLHED